MNNFFKNLKHRSWWTQNKDMVFEFDEIKGIHVVTVKQYGCFRSKERSYILTSTSSDRVATFNGTNGPVTIGITASGDEIFITPQGIFLTDYHSADKQNEDAKGINPDDAPKVTII